MRSFAFSVVWCSTLGNRHLDSSRQRFHKLLRHLWCNCGKWPVTEVRSLRADSRGWLRPHCWILRMLRRYQGEPLHAGSGKEKHFFVYLICLLHSNLRKTSFLYLSLPILLKCYQFCYILFKCHLLKLLYCDHLLAIAQQLYKY